MKKLRHLIKNFFIYKIFFPVGGFIVQYKGQVMTGIVIGTFIVVNVMLIRLIAVADRVADLQQKETQSTIEIKRKIDCLAEFLAKDEENRNADTVLENIEKCQIRIKKQSE